ncbi:MAG: HipB [Parcubacteria group bacterium]|nr:HipB [Parcubacteria group bacterium]
MIVPMDIKLIRHKDFHEQQMKDPEYAEGYEALEPEFRLISELIRARSVEGMTQKELAEKIGTKQSAIARFERGGSNPTLEFMQKLARGLGLKLTITVQ